MNLEISAFKSRIVEQKSHIFCLLVLLSLLLVIIFYQSRLNQANRNYQNEIARVSKTTLDNSNNSLTSTFNKNNNNSTIDNFNQKVILAENDLYVVEILNTNQNSKGKDDLDGMLTVKNKSNNESKEINNHIDLRFGVYIEELNTDKYIFLSEGSYTTRSIHAINLETSFLHMPFCATGRPLYWKDAYIVFNSCNTFSNRYSVGAGEAPHIFLINLETGDEFIILVADLLKSFSVDSIQGNTLYYWEESVGNPKDWDFREKVVRVKKSINLEAYIN